VGEQGGLVVFEVVVGEPEVFEVWEVGVVGEVVDRLAVEGAGAQVDDAGVAEQGRGLAVGPGAQVVFEVGALLIVEAWRGGAGVEERAQRAPDLSGGGLLEQAAQLSERAGFG
jgi:hypothetical protein